MSKHQRGLTFIELIVFIVVVSVGLVGILSVLNLTSSKSADPVVRKQSLAIAEAMLEEILSKSYQNDPADASNSSSTLGCTPTTTPSCRANNVSDRPNYNDVDDFNGWNKTGVYQPDGTLAPVLGTYVVTVAVTTATLDGVPMKKVTVTVAGGETIKLIGYRANYE